MFLHGVQRYWKSKPVRGELWILAARALFECLSSRFFAAIDWITGQKICGDLLRQESPSSSFQYMAALRTVIAKGPKRIGLLIGAIRDNFGALLRERLHP